MAETIKKQEGIQDVEAMEEARNPGEKIEKVPEEADTIEKTAETEEVKEDEYAEAPPEEADAPEEKAETEEERISSLWEPKTKLGKDVKDGRIKNIDDILNKNKKILEPEIVESLIEVQSELISVGQSKGKFGGGKRRAWRQTQKKTKEGNVPTFSTMAVVGDGDGHVGIGVGKATETLPARDKAIRKAKLNVIKLIRACASFDCACSEKHTVPFEVEGKSGSVRVVLTPAPQGTGLVVGNELKKVLKLAGIEDVYSKTFGKKRTSFNLVKACIEALEKTNPVYEKAKGEKK